MTRADRKKNDRDGRGEVVLDLFVHRTPIDGFRSPNRFWDLGLTDECVGSKSVRHVTKGREIPSLIYRWGIIFTFNLFNVTHLGNLLTELHHSWYTNDTDNSIHKLYLERQGYTVSIQMVVSCDVSKTRLWARSFTYRRKLILTTLELYLVMSTTIRLFQEQCRKEWWTSNLCVYYLVIP